MTERIPVIGDRIVIYGNQENFRDLSGENFLDRNWKWYRETVNGLDSIYKRKGMIRNFQEHKVYGYRVEVALDKFGEEPVDEKSDRYISAIGCIDLRKGEFYIEDEK